MSQLVKFGLILGMICLIASLVLAVTYEVTKPKIEQQLKEEESRALKVIIPEADSFSEKKIGDIDYFEALKSDKLIGYCLKVAGSGYNGYIHLIVGIDLDGIIRGVRVIEQYETPGLGARISEIRVGEKEPWFLKQFEGRPVNAIEVKKDIDAITGATISSKAVSEAINKAVSEFLEKQKK